MLRPRPVDALGPESIHRRRDLRLVLVLRLVLAAASAGAVSTLPTFWMVGPARKLGMATFGVLLGLCGAYLFSLVQTRRGRTELARNALFATWLGYLAIQLAMYRPDPSVPEAGMVLVGICNMFAAMIVVGIVSLEGWVRARWWLLAALSVYAVVAAGVGAVQLGWGQPLRMWATTTGISWLLLVCVAAFARAFGADLYGSVAHSALALERANDASAAKSRFLASMSHELRTPLTGILGYIELLREELADLGVTHVDRDLASVWLAASHLQAVIGDILDLSKIEADKLEIQFAPTDLGALIAQVVATTQPLAARNANALEVVSVATPTSLRTDDARLRQVLLNLLSNACKFTDRGRIELRIDGTDPASVAFAVTDTGIGIPADKLERVFLPFEQADGSTTRRFGGTGLGLAISRRLVELLGGALMVTSEVGRGSTFRFTLPR
ncbi:MAG: ATP-binding protein [Myxococcota bacterium]